MFISEKVFCYYIKSLLELIINELYLNDNLKSLLALLINDLYFNELHI